MKKNYLILWIDDEEDSVRTPIREVTHHLKKTGVLANIVYSNPTVWIGGFSSDDKVSQCLENPELDMVLMDYNLGDSFGKDLISELRERNIYVPVVYYSQQNFEDLQKSLLEENVDGVFVTHRDNLEEKTTKILDSLLKREHCVRRMRGLLLSDASELEAQGADIAERCWRLLTDDQRIIVRSKFEKYVKRSLAGNTINISNFDFNFETVEHIWTQRFFDASKRGYLVQKICQQLEWNDHLSAVKNLCGRDRIINIFPHRNDFAHQTEYKLQEYISNLKEIDFPKELRDELHRAENNMQNLLNAIAEQERS